VNKVDAGDGVVFSQNRIPTKIPVKKSIDTKTTAHIRIMLKSITYSPQKYKFPSSPANSVLGKRTIEPDPALGSYDRWSSRPAIKLPYVVERHLRVAVSKILLDYRQIKLVSHVNIEKGNRKVLCDVSLVVATITAFSTKLSWVQPL
jgi:hypothetical protein